VTTQTTSPPGRYRDVIVATFCGCLLLANVAATKLIQLGPTWSPGGLQILPLVFDGGAILYPVTYILGDVMAEVYGFAVSRRAIVVGFVLSGLASVSFWAVDVAAPAADWPNQAAWHAVLGFVPRIVVASLIGYLVGQLINARVLVWLRDRAQPGSLWFRLFGSTVVGAIADTVLFCTIAYIGLVSAGTLTNYIVTGYIYKLTVEAVLLPVTTHVIPVIRRRER